MSANRKVMQLSKFLDNSIVNTVIIKGKKTQVMNFNENIFHDIGVYRVVSTEGSYTTTSSPVHMIRGLNNDKAYYIRKDMENEEGLSYVITPRYNKNLENNAKSRFVHYTSTSPMEGSRQTFSYAFYSSVKAVREVFSKTGYFLETYGDMLEGRGDHQIRTLVQEYMPTEEMFNKIINGELTPQFEVIELCILSTYFLLKMFVLDEIEISSNDSMCKTIMQTIDKYQLKIPQEFIDAYLDYLYVLSSGCTLSKGPNGEWVCVHSSQRVFYYEVTNRAITFHGQAISTIQIQLGITIKQLWEDINVLVAYSDDFASSTYSSKNSNMEIQNIINYFIYPNIVNSEVYLDAVKNLVKELCSGSNKLNADTYESIAKSIKIQPDDTLTNALAKEIIKKLYLTYPRMFEKYQRYCLNEISISDLEVEESVSINNSYRHYNAKYSALIPASLEGNIDRADDLGILRLGTTLVDYDLNTVLASRNCKKPVNSKVEYLNRLFNTEADKIYWATYSPAIKNIVSEKKNVLSIPRVNRKGNGGNIGISQVEFLYEVLQNLVTAVNNIPRTKQSLRVDYDRFVDVLTKYTSYCKTKMTGALKWQHIYKAKKLISDLQEALVDKFSEILDVEKIVDPSFVTYKVKANIFILNNIDPFIAQAVAKVYSSSEMIQFMEATKDNGGNSSVPLNHPFQILAYRAIQEAAAQLSYFYGNFLNEYNLYTRADEFLNDHYVSGVNGNQLIGNWNDMSFTGTGQPRFEESNEYRCVLDYAEEVLIDTKELRDIMVDFYRQNELDFVNAFKDLESYLGKNDNLFSIKDCKITSHIERRSFVHTENPSKEVQEIEVQHLWVPHTIDITFTIPFPEYVRLQKQKEYSLILEQPKSVGQVKPWDSR